MFSAILGVLLITVIVLATTCALGRILLGP